MVRASGAGGGVRCNKCAAARLFAWNCECKVICDLNHSFVRSLSIQRFISCIVFQTNMVGVEGFNMTHCIPIATTIIYFISVIYLLALHNL